jgi:hypothetical protein
VKVNAPAVGRCDHKAGPWDRRGAGAGQPAPAALLDDRSALGAGHGAPVNADECTTRQIVHRFEAIAWW